MMDALAFSPAFLPNLDVDLGWPEIPPEISCVLIFELCSQLTKNLQTQSQCNETQMLPGICLKHCSVCRWVWCVRRLLSRGLQRGVLRVGSGFQARIAGQGEGQSHPLVQVLHFCWLTAPDTVACRQAFCKCRRKEKKKKVIKSRMWEGATGGRKGSRTLKELNRQLQHSHLTTGSYGLKQPRRRWEEVEVSRRRQRRPPLNLHRFDHWDKPSMAMEPRFRNYSSDSVGSDRVFLEESNYQGMLRVMDYRKGRVCRHFFSVLPPADCRCLFFFSAVFISGLRCNVK